MNNKYNFNFTTTLQKHKQTSKGHLSKIYVKISVQDLYKLSINYTEITIDVATNSSSFYTNKTMDPHVKQYLPSLHDHLQSPTVVGWVHVAQSLVFLIVLWNCCWYFALALPVCFRLLISLWYRSILFQKTATQSVLQ